MPSESGDSEAWMVTLEPTDVEAAYNEAGSLLTSSGFTAGESFDIGGMKSMEFTSSKYNVMLQLIQEKDSKSGTLGYIVNVITE